MSYSLLVHKKRQRESERERDRQTENTQMKIAVAGLVSGRRKEEKMDQKKEMTSFLASVFLLVLQGTLLANQAKSFLSCSPVLSSFYAFNLSFSCKLVME